MEGRLDFSLGLYFVDDVVVVVVVVCFIILIKCVFMFYVLQLLLWIVGLWMRFGFQSLKALYVVVSIWFA